MRRRFTRRISILLFLTFSLCGIEAQNITQPPYDPQPSYSPTATVQAQDSIVLQSAGYNGPYCIVFTELSRSPAPSLPQQQINYGLFSANGSYQLSVDGTPASAQETLAGVFPYNSKPKDRLTLDFLVEVLPTTLPAPGTNTITLRADLYRSSYPPSGRVADTAFFTITILVGSYYDVSVVPSGAVFSLSSTTTTLAFGNIQANESQGADVLVKSNIAYNLSLSSANGGAFLNTSDASKLPYSLSVNGSLTALPLGAPILVANGAPAGYGTPARYALIVTVLPYTKLPTQGVYVDTITVNLSAR